MKCPTCDHRFRQFSSWPLAVGRPIVCGECGTASVRQGRWRPVVLAAFALIAFNQFIGMFALTGVGTFLVLIGLVMLSMTLDERMMVLRPLSAASPSEMTDGEPDRGADGEDDRRS